MARNTARPLSPHLTIWRWGPHMLVSILHRATGSALAFGAVLILLWWLAAAASGEAAYATFQYYVIGATDGGRAGFIINILARIVGIGLTWSLFQHMGSGIRHFVLDTGAGYELTLNKNGAIATMVFSVVMTVLVWAYILGRAG